MQNSQTQPALRIGIDIGGTFTDFVIYDSTTSQLTSFKLPSTPAAPEKAVIDGLAKILSIVRPGSQPALLSIAHGSTVATNALLERKGAPTALVTTEGFKDAIQIGRQNRPKLYDLNANPPAPIVPAELRFEVRERVSPSGEVITPLGPDSLQILLLALRKTSASSVAITSVAVCLLFSFANPIHEQQIADRLRQEGFFVSLSSEVLPEFREYERMVATAINAFVSPVLERYLGNLQDSLQKRWPETKSQLKVMQSNGGMISVATARKEGVRCLLSGPAGGISGSVFTGHLAYPSRAGSLGMLTFDMGGTSTDVCLIQGKPGITTEAEVAGLPVHIPMLDIHTIGAGGGSIAYADAGGALRVGPQSAGAVPGPTCYGLGGEHVTVTDANLVLGRLRADNFLGGTIPLHLEPAHERMQALARQLDLDPIQTALGIIEVANAHMERALRVISVERGHDPRDFVLLSFGGAGGLHASGLARRLKIPHILIPPQASVLSALGMLVSDVIKDYSRTVMLRQRISSEELSSLFAPLLAQARLDLQSEDFLPSHQHLEETLDMRYQGQSYELSIPRDENLWQNFHTIHRQQYGYSHPQAAVEIVNLRVRAVGKQAPITLQPSAASTFTIQEAYLDSYPIMFAQGMRSIPAYDGTKLPPGGEIIGPALLIRPDTTILLQAGDTGRIDLYQNLMITSA